MNGKELYNSKNDFENIELNKMFSLTYNFDILKYIISNLINGQQKSNYKIIDLNLEKTYKDKRLDDLECDIIDLKLSGKISEQEKEKLINRKNKIQSKDYTSKIDKFTKEKDFCLKSINNPKSEKILLDEMIKDKFDNQIEEENYEDEIRTSERNVKKKELEEINQKIDDIFNQLNNKINGKSDKAEIKFKSFEKMFNTLDTNLKLTEEKMNNKFKNDLPKIVDSIYSSKIIKTEAEIENLGNKIEKDLKNLQESIHNKEEEKRNIVEKELKEKIQEINKKTKEMIKEILKINEKINDYVPFNEYKIFVSDIEKKINKENKDLNNEISKLKKIIEKIKIEIDEIINDNTDHNNLIQLTKRFDSLSSMVFNLREFQIEYEQSKKKFIDLEPSNLINKEIFNEYKDSINNILENYKKNFTDIKYILDDLKLASFNGKASLKDLKILEDNILNKINEFKEYIRENFADKNFVLKNNKYLHVQIKHNIEEYKKNEQSSSWILAKRPIGLLCASCEAYLGESKEIENEKKFIPWNKYPAKDPLDKLYNTGSGFSKILQKINSEKKLRKNRSTLEKDLKRKNDIINEEINLKKIINQNLKQNDTIQNNKSLDIDDNKEIPKLPIDKTIKNKTATNFRIFDDKVNKSDLRNSNNNIFKIKSNSNTLRKKILYKTFNNPKIEKDEVILAPNKNENIKDSGPKIVKVYKK